MPPVPLLDPLCLRRRYPRQRVRKRTRADWAAGGPLSRAGRGCSVGDQALAREVPAGLLEREVGRRQDQVGARELVVIDARALAAHEVEQRRVGGRELVLTPALD